MKRKLIIVSCITGILCANTVFAGTYTVSFIDSITQNAIKDAVVSSFQDGGSISYSTNPTDNGYELEQVEINGKVINNKNGNITIDRATDSIYNINYIFKDKQVPTLSLRETPFYLYNSAATDPKLLFEVCTDNSGVQNVELKFEKPINTKELGIQEFTVIASDKSGNKTTISDTLEIVNSCRIEMQYIDSATKMELKLPYVKGLNVANSETITIPTLPKGYTIDFIKIDNKDINSTSNTFTLNDIENKVYKVVVGCKDIENPKVKLKSSLVFTKNQAIDYKQLVEVTDNSNGLIDITGTIDTSVAGLKKQGVITVTDKSGNTNNLNVVYDVLAENYYTLKSLDSITNLGIGISDIVAQKFKIGDTIKITVPEMSNGYQLVSVSDTSGITYPVVGNTLTITGEDKTYSLIAKYKDITPPVGIAKTGLIFRRSETVLPISLVSGLSDNSKGDITVTYVTPVDTSTIGSKTASVVLTDKSGNSSLPIDIPYTIIYGSSGEKLSVKIKYIDYDTDDLVETQTISTYYGEVLDEDDLQIPSEYKLRDRNWEYTVDKEDAVKVFVLGKKYTLSIRYIDIYDNSVVERQNITGIKGDKITESDLDIPRGYYLSNNNFSKTVSNKDEIIDVKITSDGYKVNNNNNKNNNYTSKDYKITIEYYEEGYSNIIDSQVIYKDKNDTITKNDLRLPDGYELLNNFRDIKVTSSISQAIEIKKLKKSTDCVINYICNSKVISSEEKNYTFGEVIPEKELNIPEEFTLLAKASEIKAASTVNIELIPKKYTIHILNETSEKTDYTIPEYNLNKHFKEVSTINEDADFLDTKKLDSLGVLLKKYGNDIYVNSTDKWVVGSNIISFKENKFEVIIPSSGYHIKYLSGYEDSTVKPNNNITRAEAAGILYTFLAKIDNSYEEFAKGYKDVTANSWYFKYIGWGINTNLIKGYLDETIRPEGNITKAEFATLINQIKTDSIYSSVDFKYTDIDKHWAKNSIISCAEKGFFKEISGNFKPDSLITRGEVVYAINRLFGRNDSMKSNNKNTFKDLKENDIYYTEILEATYGHPYE